MMRTICHANKFAKEASATSLMPSHEILLFAGPRIQINSTSIRPFHYLFDGIVWHCTSGDVLYILFEQRMF
jgi:hypothetical protein